MRYFSAVLVALAVSTLSCSAKAEDAALCDALANIMPGANSGFSGIKRQKTDKDLYAVAVNLPYAHECELRYDRDDKTYDYACYFRVNSDGKGNMKMYADNVAACRPDMTRYTSDEQDFITFDAPQGHISLSFGSNWPNEFNVYIEQAQK